MTIWRAGGTAGLATVVRTIKSAPRPPGAALVVAPDGSVAGSVSGGCVEGAVYELATDVVARTPDAPEVTRAVRLYGIVDDGDLAYVEERVDADGGLVPHLSARLARFVG